MSASWSLADLRQAQPRGPRGTATLICRAGSIGSLALVESADGVAADTGRTLTGVAAVFDTWQEIRDLEGHYFERIAPTAFSKTLNERGNRIPLLLDHGKNTVLGGMPIGELQSISASATGLEYTADLYNGLPEVLLEGLRRGAYGSSFTAKPIKTRRVEWPGRSSHNPDSLPEVTRLEMKLVDIAPTSRPAYQNTSAKLRHSLTEDLRVREIANPSTDLGPVPYWQIRRDGDLEPAWKLLRRKDDRARVYAKS